MQLSTHLTNAFCNHKFPGFNGYSAAAHTIVLPFNLTLAPLPFTICRGPKRNSLMETVLGM